MSYRYKSAFRNSIIFVVISLAACFSHPVLGEENPCALLPKAVQLVEQIRGLRFLHPVKCRAVHEEEYTKRSIDYFFTLISQKELEYQERLYQAVGLLPETYRYSRCYLEESSRYTEAFYDIFRHEIVLPAWKRSELNLLVHEAVHALQDQHFR